MRRVMPGLDKGDDNENDRRLEDFSKVQAECPPLEVVKRPDMRAKDVQDLNHGDENQDLW